MDLQRPSPELIVWAYQRGLFPMANPHTGEIEWYDPDPRAVLPLDRAHVPRRLARLRRSERYALATDTAFERVIQECAAPRPNREETWIDGRITDAYVALHRLGLAHSVEAYRGDALVGGLYGVQLGGAFFAESMFTAVERGVRDTSKLCLIELVGLLRESGFALLDVQFQNSHIARFGCEQIPRSHYLKLLRRALSRRPAWPEPGPRLAERKPL